MKISAFKLTLFLFFSFFIIEVNAQTGISSVIAQTKDGTISGYKSDDINIFKGIPFAAPPVGDLRWKAPQPVKPWNGLLDCTKFSASPYQDSPAPFMYWSTEFLIPKEPISEDCLYLNVWSKQSPQKKPVLIYIYGGGFRSGGTACAIYDGKAVAEKGVVFVSINYRVGVFGFLAHPDLTQESGYGASGNYALLDMIAALQWVKKNIAAFGGDPDQVTIAGQSAGAFAVSLLCASPKSRGLISGAIAESGGSILSGKQRPTLDLKTAESNGVEYAKSLNCSSIADLRKKSAEEILKSNGGLSSPIIDGFVIPESLLEIYTKGHQNDVPVLLGWNGDDVVISTKRPSSAEFITQTQNTYGSNAAKLLQFYPATNDSIAAKSAGDLNRDMTFGVQGYAWANIQYKTGKAKVYVYNFNRKVPAYNSESSFGAFHSSEIVYAYDNLKTLNRPWEPVDKTLAGKMSAYWINFIKTGNPNGESLVKWPAFDSKNENILILDQQIESRPLHTKDQLAFLETLY
ncbi:MAG TPA: carboxylesterase family protein [Puia sp.]|nr:carboxylesterase family protein [Puia sp.]